MRSKNLKNNAVDFYQESLSKTACFFQPQLKFSTPGAIYKDSPKFDGKILEKEAQVKG